MSLDTDLMGSGMAPGLAGLLGFPIQTVTCTGTTQGAAAVIRANTGIALCNGQAGQTGALLPLGTPIADWIFIIGTGATAPVIYPNSATGTINGAASFTMSAAVSGYILIKTAQTAANVDTWFTIPKV